ncbi:MAG: ribosome maturation factor RimP [Fretibacterium sp.]|nr:ribosome maturation factor RimP [Fretibacterium sp.]
METKSVEQDGQRLTFAVTEVVERLGYECVHVGTKGGPGGLNLQVLIDSLGGIAVDDCEKVSQALNRMLDSEAFPVLEGRYYLEVSSPGLERPLFTPEQYGRFRGREARLRLNEPLEGRKSMTGTIEAVDEEGVTLYIAEEERKVFAPFRLIKGGNLVFRFDAQNPRKPRGGRTGSSGKAIQPRGASAQIQKNHREEEL